MNWGKCSIVVFRTQSADEKAAGKAQAKEAAEERARAPRRVTKARSLKLAAEAREERLPVYMHLQGKEIRQKENFRILGVHLHENYGSSGARAHALAKTAPALNPVRWIRDNMGTSNSMHYCSTKVLPSALFGAGVPDKNLSWATTVGNQLHRVAMDYEQTLGKGHKMVPNLALEEQTGALPWDAVVATANANRHHNLDLNSSDKKGLKLKQWRAKLKLQATVILLIASETS